MAYTDSTGRILDGRQPVTIRYGRDQSRALSPISPGEAQFILDNADRALSPENTSSPLYGQLVPARPVQITAAVGTTRGINVSGGEFGTGSIVAGGTFSNTNVGTIDVDYHYDTQATFTYLASRGITLVRIPFRWERIQPTLGAALNSAELTRLTAVVNRAGTAGLSVVLDVHNYGGYVFSGGEAKIGSGTVTQAHYTDLWTRLAAAFKTNATVTHYGLMNEPHDLSAVAGTFTSSITHYNFESTSQGWAAESGTATRTTTSPISGTGSLLLNKTMAVGYDNIRANDASGLADDISANGATLQLQVKARSANAGTGTQVRIEVQNSSFAWQAGPWYPITVGTGGTYGATVTIQYTPTAGLLANCRAIGIQFEGSGLNGSTDVQIDQVQQGNITGGLSAAEVWEAASQAALTAIRTEEGLASHKTVLVAGYNWSGAQQWTTSHPDPWISDGAANFRYEAHLYFDNDNSGTYAASYATENTNAIGQGYASVTARALAQLGVFDGWLNTYGVAGFIGEVGWPDTTSWNAVGAAVYQVLRTASLPATYWATGEWWGTGYPLSAYEQTGTAVDTPNGQAAIIEAYPVGGTTTLFVGQIDDFTVVPGTDAKHVEAVLVDALGALRGTKVSTDLYRGLRTGEALHVLLDAAGVAADARDIDVGATVMPFWWLDDEDAYDAAMDLIASEGPPALITVDTASRIVFLDRHHRLQRTASTTAQSTWRSGDPEPSISDPTNYNHGWKEIVNSVTFQMPQRAIAGAPSQVWSSSGQISIADGDTLRIVAQAADPFTGAITPVQTTAFDDNGNGNGDYTLLTGAVTVTLSRTSGLSTVIFVRAAGGPAVIADLQLRAYSVATVNTVQMLVEDQGSIDKYGRRSLPDERTPKWASMGDAQAIASIILGARAERLPTISVTMVGAVPARLTQQLTRNLSDRVHVIESHTGLDADCFIEQISHQISEGGADHRTTFGLEKAPAQITGAFILGSSTSGFLGTNRLGRRAGANPSTMFVLGTQGVLGTNILTA